MVKPLQNISSKLLTKLQLQNLASELQLQNLDQTSYSKSEQNFTFLTKPQLPNLQQTVANTTTTVAISTSFVLAPSQTRVLSIKSTKQQLVS